VHPGVAIALGINGPTRAMTRSVFERLIVEERKGQADMDGVFESDGGEEVLHHI